MERGKKKKGERRYSPLLASDNSMRDMKDTHCMVQTQDIECSAVQDRPKGHHTGCIVRWAAVRKDPDRKIARSSSKAELQGTKIRQQ